MKSYIYAYKRNVIFLDQRKIRKVCEWSGKGIGVVKVCEKSAAKFIF